MIVLIHNNYMYFCFSHEDLKELLESNKDPSKLEAMKTIIGVSLKYLGKLDAV